jgi:hypothetical protein
MRRELASCSIALGICAAAAGCRQSVENRARHAAVREEREASVRETPAVERVSTPTDSGRILYDAPPDLSASSPGRPGVAINGADSSSQKPDSSSHSARKAAPAP